MTLRINKKNDSGNIFTNRYFLANENSNGEQYDIRGLNTFLRSSEAPKGIEIPSSVADDLRRYREYCEKKKRIWMREGSRESKEKLTRKLQGNI